MPATNATFVRWRKGESRRCRIFPPLEPDHPAHGSLCLLCGHKLGQNVAELGVQLVALFPSDNGDREKFTQGRWVTCHALILHAHCVALCTDADLDELAGCVRFEPLLPELEAHDGRPDRL